MAIQSKCKKCSNDFLIITKEEEYYKEKDLPLPKLCPECRYERRISLRNKKKLIGYNCDSCGNDIITAVEPEEGLQIFCKTCYQKFLQENDCILGYSDAAKAEMGGDTNKNESPSTPNINEKTDNGSAKDPVSW